MITLVATLIFSSVLSSQTAKNQTFDPHNLTGVWLLRTPFAGISNHPPAMTPAGKAKFDANKPSYGPRAVPPAEGNDVIGNCDPTGFPRNMFSPSRPVQFVQLPNELLQVFQYHGVWRAIWSDGRLLPKDPDPLWYGYSVGKWDGDTFVVSTIGLNEKTWLDHFGYPHSDEMRLQERYHRLDRDTLELTMTLTDPKMYTAAWISEKKVLKLVAGRELPELFCVPSEEQAFNRRVRNPAGGVK